MAPAVAAPDCPVAYQVQALSLQAHLFAITLTIAQPAPRQVLSLPVWIAGSYLVREFSKNLQCLQAWQGDATVAVTQQDKCTWQVENTTGQPLQLRYQVYAYDNSVRTAWLDTERGFFNGTSLFLRVHGQEDGAHQLTLNPEGLPGDWQVASALPAQQTGANGFGSYLAGNYDALVDAPVEMGAFWSGSFVAGGITHRFVVAGAAPSFDGARLLADTQAICEAEINFWHGEKPHSHYLFMLNAVDNSYGGLEHSHSTALICKRADLPRVDQATTLSSTDGYTALLGLISHEYFHTWNVKRLRPAEFASYDYARENYTELLWFFEGFTSYFHDLLLRRAGLIDDATYLALLNKTINQVLQTPGRKVQSVAQASFDAWVKYYRQDENTVNATISYYTKGSLVALCLDLSLRQGGNTSLDAVMQGLWQRCQAGPMTQNDLLTVLAELSGQTYEAQLAHWVHGTDDLPLQELLQQQGISWAEEPAPLAERLGLRTTESSGVRIKSVLRDSVAEQAGFASGDEWLGVEIDQGAAVQGWRLAKLDELPLYLGTAQSFKALIARDQRLRTLTVTLSDSAPQIKLSIADSAQVSQWLGQA
ncbi:MAG: M61 family metallopeptidase [Comamonadaceae bacterium]|nr:M61 family metallopeptidase [Comamonadaceae bacterium]